MLQTARPLTEKIRTAVACPDCHAGPLSLGEAEVSCGTCRRRYPLLGGTPLLLEEGSPTRGWYLSDRASEAAGSVENRVRWALRRPEDRLWSRASLDAIGRILRDHDPDREGTLVMVMGAGYERVFRAALDRFDDVLRLGLAHEGSVHVIGDAMNLPLRDSSIDAILSSAVLEHVLDPERAMRECWRVLKPGGSIYADIPFMRGYHAVPIDYQRYTIAGIEAVFARSGFEMLDKGICSGPANAVALSIPDLLRLVPGRSVGAGLRIAASWAVHPLKYLDRLLADRPGAEYFACNFFYLGRKPRGQAG